MTVTLLRLAACLIAASFVWIPAAGGANDLRSAATTEVLKRSADWQLANPGGIEIREWIIAPLYDGLPRTSPTTGDLIFRDRVGEGEQSDYSMGPYRRPDKPTNP
jgi:hypothetical protein